MFLITSGKLKTIYYYSSQHFNYIVDRLCDTMPMFWVYRYINYNNFTCAHACFTIACRCIRVRHFVEHVNKIL